LLHCSLVLCVSHVCKKVLYLISTKFVLEMKLNFNLEVTVVSCLSLHVT